MAAANTQRKSGAEKSIGFNSPDPFTSSSEESGIQLKKDSVAQFAPQPPPGDLPGKGVRSADADGEERGVNSYLTESRAGEYLDQGSAVQEYTPGWAWIQNVGKMNYWVNFHMVNAIVGGQGLRGNLTPTSKATNSGSDWRNFEETCKDEQAERPVHVATEVSYHDEVAGADAGTLDAVIHFFPDSITARLDSHDGEDWNNIANVDANINPLRPPADPTILALSAVPNARLREDLGISNSNATRLKGSIDTIKAIQSEEAFFDVGYNANEPEGFCYFLIAWNDDEDGGNGMLNARALDVLKENIYSGLWEI